MKLAFAAIVKPSDAEAILLDRCLESIKGVVDGIFITQAGQAPNKNVSKVIKRHKGTESFYTWNKSFADARNFNFSQVPDDYDYIFWLDADDVLRGGERLRSVIEDNDDVDTFSLFYLYAFDEWKNPIVVHHKTRVVRNDGCVRWAGDIHEDFAENRRVSSRHIDGIEVLHLTNPDRMEESKVRNHDVSLHHASRNPNDPRSYWVVANALLPLGKYTEALEQFERFLKTSQSEDEKYIAYLRIAEAEVMLGNKDKATDALRYAIGLKPFFPDAYIALGRLFYDMGKYADAVALLKHSLTIPVPYHKIMVFNPRDYDFTPLKWLAYAYLGAHQHVLAFECFKQMLKITPKDERLKDVVSKMKDLADKQEEMHKLYERIKFLPKDQLKVELDAIPDEFKSDPLFTNLRNVNFIKEESSGKDLVIMCGYTTREWTPKALEEGIGGSEEAVIHLARQFAEAGYTVTVYNNCGHKGYQDGKVTYRPFWTWNYRDKQDITILWRHPQMANFPINSTKIFVDMHDVISPGEFTETRLSRIDKVFVKSQFHRSLFPNVPDEKIAVIPNGIVLDDFKTPEKRDPYLIINTSSPDRSLSALARLFKRVKAQVPDAKCEWMYGWGNFDDNYADNAQMMAWKAQVIKDMKDAGITDRGRLSHQEVAKAYKRARIFGYPTEFAEIDCISARKAQIAGAIPVTTDFAALNETVQFGVKVHSKKTKDDWCLPYQFDFALNDPEAEDKWVETVVEILTKEDVPWVATPKWGEQFSWDTISNRWIAEF